MTRGHAGDGGGAHARSWRVRARAAAAPVVAALAAVLLSLAIAAPVQAQEPTQQRAAAERTAKERRLLEKLRSIESLVILPVPADSADSTLVRRAIPDSTAARLAAERWAADSAGADSGAAGLAAADSARRQPGIKAAEPARADSPYLASADSTKPGAGVLKAAEPGAADSQTAIAGVKGALPPRPDTARTGAAGSRARGAYDPVPMLGEAGENDPVLATLLQLEGYTVTEYTGTAAHFSADSGIVELTGKADLAREGQRMTADSLLVFDQNQSTVCGYGQPVLSGATGNPVTSNQVCYDVEQRLGVAKGARTTFAQSGEWFIHGEEAYTRGDDRLYGAHTDFTSCDLEEPHYHFSAGHVKIVHESVMVARDVTLNFGDVPVFWLPFMVQSLKQGRRSGLLAPRFGINDIARTDSDYNRHLSNLGFYWAINDYLGAQAALDWFSGNYTSMDAQLQFNWARQFLRGNFALRQYWPSEGPSQFTLRGNGSWQATERTSLSVGGTFASQGAGEFISQNTFNPRELNRDLTANLSLSHRFDWANLSLGARRQQSLSNGKVASTFPGASLNISPITLFAAPADEASWYNNATWNASGQFNTRTTEFGTLTTAESSRNLRTVDAGLTSSLSFGGFSWTQSATFAEEMADAKPMILDTVSGPAIDGGELQVDTSQALPRSLERSIVWNTGLSYQQRLIGTSTLSPSLTLRGELREDSLTAGQPLAAPMRVDFGVSLNTDLYGFWPGVGPFSRIRHRISPTISYRYSPAPSTTSALQDSVFGVDLQQVNRLSLTVNQTFEAKYETDDSVAADTADALAEAAAGGEPQRLPQARKIKLLGLTTSAVAYDFVRADLPTVGGSFWDGVVQTTITNTVSSDLFSGLSLSFSHDLFELREEPGFDRRVYNVGEPGAPGFSEEPRSSIHESRHLAPHLRSLNARFSLNSDSWLFRALGLGPSQEEIERDSIAADSIAAEMAAADSAAADSAQMLDRGMNDRVPGLLGESRSAEDRWDGGPAGSWNANFTYSLDRPRDGVADQMLQADLSFQPTENWQVSWRTGYSFTEGEFSDHSLRLTRDLHRWTANFDFTKTQTGNVLFQFFVQLKDNPDLKFDYHQRGTTALR